MSVALLLLIPVAAPCAVLTVGPSDCSDVAVNNAMASAQDGDTVQLTCSGTTTWNNTVTIPNTKGITIKGPGCNTPKSSATFPLIVQLNNGTAPAIQINCENNMSLVRVTGLKFQGTTTNNFVNINGRGLGKTNLGAYRIDNCYFDSVVASSEITLVGTSGELTGLVDDCTFHDCSDDGYTIRVRETYIGGGSPGCYGYDSWQRPFNFGDNHFHFIEDCLFEALTRYNRHYVSCDGAGGRYVVRFCTLDSQLQGTSPDYIDAHGDGTNGLGTGTRGGEIYGNTFLGTAQTVGRDISIRGGQFLIYNNTFTTSGYGTTPIHMTEYRASTIDCWELLGITTSWCTDSSGLTHNNGLDACNSSVPQGAKDTDFATWYPLPGQIRGTYLWNNLLNGANQPPYLDSENYLSTYIQAGRDFWVSTSQPAALAGYSPYTYPHPLRQLIPPPTGFHLVQ